MRRRLSAIVVSVARRRGPDQERERGRKGEGERLGRQNSAGRAREGERERWRIIDARRRGGDILKREPPPRLLRARILQSRDATSRTSLAERGKGKFAGSRNDDDDGDNDDDGDDDDEDEDGDDGRSQQKVEKCGRKEGWVLGARRADRAPVPHLFPPSLSLALHHTSPPPPPSASRCSAAPRRRR